MKMRYFLGFVAVLLVVLAVAAPIGPLPGFIIGGNAAPVPEQWGDTSNVHEIKFKVPGTIPRVVTIWVIAYGPDLYVMSAGESGWTSKLGDGGPVEMRMNDSTFSLTATRVSEGVRPIIESYIDKYKADYGYIVDGFPPVEGNEDTFLVFKLEKP